MFTLFEFLMSPHGERGTEGGSDPNLQFRVRIFGGQREGNKLIKIRESEGIY
mgnify:CR=1 FL=1